jgi:hypothetical protein
MTREEAEAALRAWATVTAQRDELVEAAHQAGVSKNRIHTLTGIARTTIDRILEAPVGTTQQTLTEYLARYTANWPRHEAWGWGGQPSMSDSYTPAYVAQALLGETEFRALKLGTWLNTPSGEVLAAAVEQLSPPPYAQDAQLLIEALQLAAKQQQNEARKTLLAGAAFAGVLAWAAIGTAGK